MVMGEKYVYVNGTMYSSKELYLNVFNNNNED